MQFFSSHIGKSSSLNKDKSTGKEKNKRTKPGSSTTPTVNLKVNYGKKIVCGDVGQMLDPKMNLKQAPVNSIEEWALGLAIKTVHQGANKCISNTSTIEFYENVFGAVKDYHKLLKDSNAPPPPKVQLNLHNIHDVHNAILQVLTYFQFFEIQYILIYEILSNKVFINSVTS